tara:strand:+ start:75 stop:875 length:801 start_codon:yes stop_codon:yes gene_type:complete
VKQVIPVWVINLKKRPDRLLKIGNQLDQMGLSWERIDAVDGRNCDKKLLNISRKSGKIGSLSKSVRGCTASHFKFWKLLSLSNFMYGIILEDDVELSNDFKDLVCDSSWIPNTSNIIKLEKFAGHRASKLLLGPPISSALNNTRTIHKMYSKHAGTGAYLMTKSGAEIASNWTKLFSVPVDHLLFNENVSKLSSSLEPLILVPPIAWQLNENGDFSNIDDDIKKPLPKLYKYIRSIKRGYYECRLLPYQLIILLSGKAKIKLVEKK